MLNTTNVKLEVISDANMYLFFEKGMRDGVSCISKRFSQANNKYLKSYDPKQESKHIIYLEVIVYIFMQCLNFFQEVDSNGLILKIFTSDFYKIPIENVKKLVANLFHKETFIMKNCNFI